MYDWTYYRMEAMRENESVELKTSIKETVEEAITDYIATNFDL